MPFMPRRSQQGSVRTLSSLSGSTPVRSRRSTVVSKSQGTASSVATAKPVSLTKFIKNVAKGLSETKRTMFFGAPQNFNVQTGLYADAGIEPHNQMITQNTTDIRRIIPYIVQGTSDNQRIGESVRPTSLTLRGRIGINIYPTINEVPAVRGQTDVVAVLYILQHKQLKSYSSLSSLNDFTQLLETGENTTVAFGGQQWHAQMPVSNQYYQLIKKKKYTLRWAGENAATLAIPSNGHTSPANAHNYTADFSFNLRKHLPAKLLYPENNSTTGLNDPTNSSMFFCVGYYLNGVLVNTTDPTSFLMLQYTAELLYKDA